MADQLSLMDDIGVTSIVHGGVRYRDAIEFSDIASTISESRGK